MKVSVTKKFSFEACHFLPHYRGACNNLHGHSYEMEVTVSGEVIKDHNNEKVGMILDFKDLKHVVNDLVVNGLDHSNLNDTFPNPTAEVMGTTIFEILRNHFDGKGLTLERIRLWETRDSYVEVTRE